MRRTLWIAFAVALLVGVCLWPPPERAYAVADLTSGKDDGYSIPAGAADFRIEFESGYRPTEYTILPSTATVGILYNDESSSGKIAPVGAVRNTVGVKGLRALTIDRSVADAGCYVEWKQ